LIAAALTPPNEADHEMQPWIESLLWGWTALAAAWWLISLRLARGVLNQPDSSSARQSSANRFENANGEQLEASVSALHRSAIELSVFKALPPLFGGEVSPSVTSALESFVSQLDEHTELLLGIQESDYPQWREIVGVWRNKYPVARMIEVCVPRPNHFLSPKVSWYHVLAQKARGALWMWSDADMIAPRGFLRAARQEYVESQAELLTCAYVARSIRSAPMLLEALFVNVEFFPGVLCCKKLGAVRFGFGACLLFSVDAFFRRVTWERLGVRIADDFVLGNRMAPVKVSEWILETLPAENRWRDAVQHYLRWHKTVRWCRSHGYAGQIVIMPLIAWLTFVLVQPANWLAWLGLGISAQIEALAAIGLFQEIDCRVRPRHLWTVFAWTFLRPLVWLACWFPGSVVFRSQKKKWSDLYTCAGDVS